MQNYSRGRGYHPRQVPVKSPPMPTAQSAPQDPPVRRWPHPVTGVEPLPKADPGMHYLRCVLSYQNQLLAEIKTLLEEIQLEQREGKESS